VPSIKVEATKIKLSNGSKFRFLKTYQRIKNYFLGEGMKKDIQKFVRECHIFQINEKSKNFLVTSTFIHT
jgi:hypothetical protein